MVVGGGVCGGNGANICGGCSDSGCGEAVVVVVVSAFVWVAVVILVGV